MQYRLELTGSSCLHMHTAVLGAEGTLTQDLLTGSVQLHELLPVDDLASYLRLADI